MMHVSLGLVRLTGNTMNDYACFISTEFGLDYAGLSNWALCE